MPSAGSVVVEVAGDGELAPDLVQALQCRRVVGLPRELLHRRKGALKQLWQAVVYGCLNMTQWARAERIAREVHEGRSSIRLPDASVNYHANYVRPSWGARLERVRQIGAHIFYGAPRPGFETPGANERGKPPVSQTGLVFVDMATGRPLVGNEASAAP